MMSSPAPAAANCAGAGPLQIANSFTPNTEK